MLWFIFNNLKLLVAEYIQFFKTIKTPSLDWYLKDDEPEEVEKVEESSESLEGDDLNDVINIKIFKHFTRFQVKSHFRFKINVLFNCTIFINNLQKKLEEMLNLLQSKVSSNQVHNEDNNDQEIEEENNNLN